MRDIEIFFGYCEGRTEAVSYALSEDMAREAALDSCWVDELGGDVTVASSKHRAYEIAAEVEHNHICWQCPVCHTWNSEDYEEGDVPPALVCCGMSRHHPDAENIWILVSWKAPEMVEKDKG